MSHQSNQKGCGIAPVDGKFFIVDMKQFDEDNDYADKIMREFEKSLRRSKSIGWICDCPC